MVWVKRDFLNVLKRISLNVLKRIFSNIVLEYCATYLMEMVDGCKAHFTVLNLKKEFSVNIQRINLRQV